MAKTLSLEKKTFLHNIEMKMSQLFPFASPEVWKFIACQFALESNFGKSRIAIENHNLCGMKLPMSRPTTALGERFDHAYYNDIVDCCVDYAYWIVYKQPMRFVFEAAVKFARFLNNNHYCPSIRYTDSIFDLYEQYSES